MNARLLHPGFNGLHFYFIKVYLFILFFSNHVKYFSLKASPNQEILVIKVLRCSANLEPSVYMESVCVGARLCVQLEKIKARFVLVT